MFIEANFNFIVLLVIAISILVVGATIAVLFFLPQFIYKWTESTVRSSIGSVVFVRHGESEWNSANLYAGWYDTMLTETGIEQAKTAGRHLNKLQIQLDFVHTSLLTRAIQTTENILSEMPGLFNGTINTNWLLNERHVGALSGTSKVNSNWTTHWNNRPPPMLPTHPYYDEIHNDARYQNVDAVNGLPNTESLADTQQRFITYWMSTIEPQIRSGERILVIAHQNFLRGVIKYFDQLTEAAASSLKIENSAPFIYEFDQNLNPQNKFVYLYSKSMQ